MKLLEDELLESKMENKKLKESCDIKDKKIQELELEMLKVTNKMAAMATDHAQQKQTLNDEINELKVHVHVSGFHLVGGGACVVHSIGVPPSVQTTCTCTVQYL